MTTLSRQQAYEAAIAAYEAATPDDYRYSATALRQAVDAVLALQALDAGQPVAWQWKSLETDAATPYYFDRLSYGPRPNEDGHYIKDVQPLYRAPVPASSVEALALTAQDVERIERRGLEYARIIGIVNECVTRMVDAGESHAMLAKWISEGLNAALFSPPQERVEAEALRSKE
jgi:hypothetical protein